MDDMTVDEIVEAYDLEPHPEGGYYREVWRSERTLPEDVLPEYPGDRDAGTSILYLLPTGEISDYHRVRSEELWVYHRGNPLTLSIRPEMDEPADAVELGPGPDRHLQSLVPADWWQAAEPLDGPCEWSLMGCIVVPGFDFDDFEMF